MNRNPKLKKVIKIGLLILLLLLFFIIYYLIAFFDTNELMDYVDAVINGDIAYEEIENEPVEFYYYKAQYDDFSTIEFDNTRVFVCHNFSEGYIWLHEWYRITDSNGDLVSARGYKEWPRYYEVLTKWTIKKENGKWKIIDIDSHP